MAGFDRAVPDHSTTVALAGLPRGRVPQGKGMSAGTLQGCLLAVQRLAGNRAATLLVQRCGNEMAPGCPCAEGEVPIQRQTPAPAFELPAGSVYGGLPGPLLDLLKRSFKDRVEGRPGTGHNLDNAFWGGPASSLEQALNRMGTAGIDLMAEIGARSNPLAFAKIQYVQNAWSGTSRGFNFSTADIPGIESELRGDARYCRDTPTGESEHRPARCYRETVAGAHGVHFCLHETAGCGVHIDMHQTVDGKLETGFCDYSWRSLPGHWNDVFLLGPSISPFELVDGDRGHVDRLGADIAALDQTDARKAQLQRDYAPLSARMSALEEQARRLAVQGESGERQAETSIRPEATNIAGEVARLRGILEPPRPMPPRAG